MLKRAFLHLLLFTAIPAVIFAQSANSKHQISRELAYKFLLVELGGFQEQITNRENPGLSSLSLENHFKTALSLSEFEYRTLLALAGRVGATFEENQRQVASLVALSYRIEERREGLQQLNEKNHVALVNAMSELENSFGSDFARVDEQVLAYIDNRVRLVPLSRLTKPGASAPQKGEKK